MFQAWVRSAPKCLRSATKHRRASSGRSSCCVTCQVPLLRLPGWAHHHDLQALMPPDGQHALAASGSTTLTAADVAASGSPTVLTTRWGLRPLALLSAARLDGWATSAYAASLSSVFMPPAPWLRGCPAV